ncbi:MAG: pyrimidine-nucleoside phosphorylase [Saprospiraceae bacterium]|nr:pyrimidine-nucleoside phosphorylase [Saprospiraceae bacterium]
MLDLIKKKRNGGVHSPDEINEIIDGFVFGHIPDYQVAAWLMAVYFNGLNDQETAYLTDAMMRSGDLIDLSSIPGIKIDKHSTGGVGDKTTLVLGPLVAAAGVPIAKMSGRGLGHTGGTLDKLESIPGFNVDMTAEHFCDLVKKHGIAICSQNSRLVPADKKLYALRDVTGTVDNISLIASSVMSKKLACGADGIVIDLKIGDGAFIKTIEDASKLAEIMLATAKNMGRKLVAVVTDMEEPLGYAIGNSLEVIEAIHTLQGKGPDDLTELCLELGAQMMVLGGKADGAASAKKQLRALLENGKAFEKFVELVKIQGGNIQYALHTGHFKKATYKFEFKATFSGFVKHLNAMEIGLASVKLGAGRETKESAIDHSAGIELIKKVGDTIIEGDVLAVLHCNNEKLFVNALEHMQKAYTFSTEKPEETPLIKTIFA